MFFLKNNFVFLFFFEFWQSQGSVQMRDEMTPSDSLLTLPPKAPEKSFQIPNDSQRKNWRREKKKIWKMFEIWIHFGFQKNSGENVEKLIWWLGAWTDDLCVCVCQVKIFPTQLNGRKMLTENKCAKGQTLFVKRHTSPAARPSVRPNS